MLSKSSLRFVLLPRVLLLSPAAIGQRSSLSCYFFPLVSPACEQRARAAIEARALRRAETLPALRRLLRQRDVPFVRFAVPHWLIRLEAGAAT